MSGAYWRFRPKGPDEMHVDPMEPQFFAPQDIADKLLREASQNTLDAGTGGPVRLVLTLGQAGPDARRYLDGLWPHLEAQRELRGHLPGRLGGVPFLTVEDFGTSGLTGDADLDPADPDEDDRFFWFFKNVGRTGKRGGDRGSWGIGKTVFPSASALNTFFGLTIRDDGRRLLMGQAQLREHRLTPSLTSPLPASTLTPSHPLDPYGFYALHPEIDGFQVQRPVESPDELQHFRDTFRLVRDGQSGLSVVMPHPVPEAVEPARLALAAAEHCFVPILQGHLTVEVRGHDAQPMILDARGLLPTVEQLPGLSADERRRLRARLEFARWALDVPEPKRIVLPRPDGPVRAVDRDLIGERLPEMAAAFTRGERLAVRVPVLVEPKAGEPLPSYFDVYLERDASLDGPDDHYVRRGVLASELHGRVASGVRALTLVEDAPLAELLRASEDVPHTSWRERDIDRVTRHYQRGTVGIGLAKRAAAELSRLLLTADERPDDRTLASLFPRPTSGEGAGEHHGQGRASDEARGGDDPGTGEGESTPPTRPVPPLGPPAYRWSVLPGGEGFRVRGEPRSTRPLRALRARAAYATLRGGALSRYTPDDFMFDEGGDLTLGGAGFEVWDRRDNELTFMPTERDFLLEVRGFLPGRALTLRITPLRSEDHADAVSDGADEDSSR